jgi:hypothetical protein
MYTPHRITVPNLEQEFDRKAKLGLGKSFVGMYVHRQEMPMSVAEESRESEGLQSLARTSKLRDIAAAYSSNCRRIFQRHRCEAVDRIELASMLAELKKSLPRILLGGSLSNTTCRTSASVARSRTDLSVPRGNRTGFNPAAIDPLQDRLGGLLKSYSRQAA